MPPSRVLLALERFELVQSAHDRVGIVLMNGEFGNRARRPQANVRVLLRAEQILERFDGTPRERLHAADADLEGGLPCGRVRCLESLILRKPAPQCLFIDAALYRLSLSKIRYAVSRLVLEPAPG